MFRTAYQRGMLTIFFSVGSKPLAIWDTYIRDGYITRFLDQDIKSMVLEVGGTNVSTTYMVCPKGNAVLGITMPFLIMVVKNLKKYFSFEVTILDDTGTRRRFRVSNFQSTTQIQPLCTVMPIGLSEGWNQIQFNLAEFTRKAYKKQFVEVQKLKINANIRLRRVYFAERILPDDQLPAEYKLYFPLKTNKKTIKATSQKEITPEKGITSEKDIMPAAPAELTVLEEKVSKSEPSAMKVSTSKASIKSIKSPSQHGEQEEHKRPSRILEVKEDSLERTGEQVDVTIVTDAVSEAAEVAAEVEAENKEGETETERENKEEVDDAVAVENKEDETEKEPEDKGEEAAAVEAENKEGGTENEPGNEGEVAAAVEAENKEGGTETESGNKEEVAAAVEAETEPGNRGSAITITEAGGTEVNEQNETDAVTNPEQ